MCLFENCIENRRKVSRRGIDHLQHLGRCRLLFQRLPLLGQKSRILHRYDRLGCEILEQSNFFLGEWANLTASRGDHSEKYIVPTQRDA